MRRDEKSEDKEEVSLPTSPPQSSVSSHLAPLHGHTILFFCLPTQKIEKHNQQRLSSAKLVYHRHHRGRARHIIIIVEFTNSST